MSMHTEPASGDAAPRPRRDHLRFLRRHQHLEPTFGESWFAIKAESFARFFGTPLFLGAQTAVVAAWILLNVTGVMKFDLYPFILLNLAFSLQSAYAAPLILLAQTRQAARDKAQSEADAQHREALAQANEEWQRQAVEAGERQRQLLEQNTRLTELTQQLTERVETLTVQMHKHLLEERSSPGGQR